jgi:hypothetical protein
MLRYLWGPRHPFRCSLNWKPVCPEATSGVHPVVSVDGFIADAEDNVGPLFEWYFNGDAEIVDGGPFKVSRDSARYMRRCGSVSGRPSWEGICST